MELLHGKWVRKKVYFKYVNDQFKKAQGKKLNSAQHTGMAREDDRFRGKLLLKRNKKFFYLRQDLKPGVSSKVKVLEWTNINKDTMPYEHLTFRRIDDILY